MSKVVNGRCAICGDLWSVHRPGDVTLTLSKYQRDNLLSLLVAVWGWAYESEPGLTRDDLQPSRFNHLNTGDWVGEIPWLLGYKGTETDWGTPNATAAELVRRQQRLVSGT